jgi:hypothetical protein
MNLKKEPLYRVLVERTGFAFFVDFEFENLPEYCHFCNNIGHNQSYCKRITAEKKNVDMEDHFKQPQKKEYKVVKSNKKDIVSEPIVEVANSEQSSPPKVIEIDPILEGLLRNNEDRVPAASVTVLAPPVHVVNSNPVIDNVVVEVQSSSNSEFMDATQPDFNEAGVTC